LRSSAQGADEPGAGGTPVLVMLSPAGHSPMGSQHGWQSQWWDRQARGHSKGMNRYHGPFREPGLKQEMG